jgi:hypothetical protein
LKRDAWRPSVRWARCDRTQGQRSVRLTGVSGGVGLSSTLSIMALFFEGLINLWWLAPRDLSWSSEFLNILVS